MEFQKQQLSVCVNVENVGSPKDLQTHPEVLGEGKLADINEESGFAENDDVPEEAMLAKHPKLKDSHRYFITLKAQRINCSS